MSLLDEITDGDFKRSIALPTDGLDHQSNCAGRRRRTTNIGINTSVVLISG
jgi:hypothetical protein